MKRKSSIVKFYIIGAVLIIGIILSFFSFDIGLTSYNSFASSIKLGLDLKGGVYAVYNADDSDTDDIDSRMEGTRASLIELLTGKGYTEATVEREGTYGLRVEIPDIENPAGLLKVLGEPADLRFELNGEVILTGDSVVSAASGYQDGYVVSLNFNSEGAKAFATATTEHIGESIDIIINVGGEEKTISTAKIETAITNGRALITGMANLEAAENLANQIMSGTFSVSLSLVESSTISATLGEKALTYGLIAGGVGLVLVIVFMICFYGLFGVLGAIALLLYTVMMLFFLAVFPWVQLTLPGIAGVLLSIGMAIDGNVIIYERIKDEYRNGKSILSAAHYGFRKSCSAIVDGNVTTLIASIVLIIFGTGSVKGFGITLIIGIVLSLFSSLVITRELINCAVTLNNHDNRLYKLKRGKGFENVEADANDAEVQQSIDAEQREKREKKRMKKAEKKGQADKGGLL